MAATKSARACSLIRVMSPRRRGSRPWPYIRRAALQMLTARSAERSISATILTAGDQRAQVDRHRRLQRHHPVALLLEVDGPGIDLVVRGDQVVGALEVAVEEDLVARGMASITEPANRTIWLRISSSSW